MKYKTSSEYVAYAQSTLGHGVLDENMVVVVKNYERLRNW